VGLFSARVARIHLMTVAPGSDKPNISARAAVDIGQRVVNLPVMGIILMSLLGAKIVLDRHRPFGGLALVLGAFVAAWTYWSFAIPRWRRWALRRGAPATELQRLAVAAKLAWPKGSFFEKTELRLRGGETSPRKDHPPQYDRHPKNAAGPFYVVGNHCISCGAPEAEAPTLVTGCGSQEGCYVFKQPETPEEVSAAIRAMFVSCIEVYRYGGTDPEIRRRLAELGHADLCDHPLEGHAVVVRNLARFSLPVADGAIEIGRLLLAALITRYKNGHCTRPIARSTHLAEFEYAASAKYGKPNEYTIEQVGEGAWLLSNEHRGVWLHDLLYSIGAEDIRWFSPDEWGARAAGRELPY